MPANNLVERLLRPLARTFAAHYIDPGTGSMIAATLAAGLAGIGVAIKMSWGRIAGVFSPKTRARNRELAAARAAKQADAGPVDD